jgi:hypothetical protein
MAKMVNSSRSSPTNGANTVWSLTEPCTNTSGGPSPSTQTAIDPPSPDLTSHRSATPPILRCSHHNLPEASPHPYVAARTRGFALSRRQPDGPSSAPAASEHEEAAVAHDA